jgi:hypothetical protein
MAPKKIVDQPQNCPMRSASRHVFEAVVQARMNAGLI